VNAVYVTRHGQSTWNAERRWAGRADPPLTELGRTQAREASKALAPLHFDSVASSALVRSTETASILASALKLPLLAPNPLFDERFGGAWSGLTSAEIEARCPASSSCGAPGLRWLLGPGRGQSAFCMKTLFGSGA
jgi:probable phosphoglycerate mutase